MFSDCEDDLCIFVCGTCKRYFTQLSAFAQHKKEKLCQKKFLDEQLAKGNVTENHIAEETSEEIDSDENADVQKTPDIVEDSNEPFTKNEEHYFNSQKRKYPRKQDKTKIKRTVRDFDPENQTLLGEPLGLETNREIHSEEAAGRQTISESSFPAIPFPGLVRAESLFGKPSGNVGIACQHPVFVCRMCHAEFPNTPSKTHRCSYCRRGFFTEGELTQHILRAKHNNLCEVCGKIFPDKYKLRKHALSHVTEKNFPCEVPGCTKAFKSTEDVKTHVKYVHAVEKRFKCFQCPRAFSRPDKYKLHLFTHKGPASYALGVRSVENGVPGRVQSPGNNDLALTRYAGENHTVGKQSTSNVLENNSHHPFEQNSFPATNDRLSSPAFHKETGNEITALNLPTVENSADFRSVATRSEEDASHVSEMQDDTKSPVLKEVSIEERYHTACSSPPSTTLTKVASSENDSNRGTCFTLTTNSEAVGETAGDNSSLLSSPSFKCNDCDLHFNDEETLNGHIQVHLDASVPAGEDCVRCGTRFSNPSDLGAHEERRPDHVLRCEHCSVKFLSVCDLQLHRREAHNLASDPEVSPGLVKEWRSVNVAAQPRKHVCAECGKAFTRADKLRRHSIIHSPDRPCIPCMCRDSHGCTLTFYRKDSMKRHALTHTLEKPYKCDICAKTFSRQDYVTKHISQVHKRIFKHRCTLCDYGTREPKRLRIHIRSRHEINPDIILPSLNTNHELGSKTETSPETQLENMENLASPGGMVSPEAMSPPEEKTSPERTVRTEQIDLEELDMADPSHLSQPPATVQTSAPDAAISEHLDEDSAGNRGTPSSTIPECTIQQYNRPADIPGLNRTNSNHFATAEDALMTFSEGYSYKESQLKMLKERHKTPLNSLPVPPQQSNAFYGLGGVVGRSPDTVLAEVAKCSPVSISWLHNH